MFPARDHANLERLVKTLEGLGACHLGRPRLAPMSPCSSGMRTRDLLAIDPDAMPDAGAW